MKKIFAILLAVTMLASMATVVSAAESTTTLTTTVPAATYTLNIPANQKIEYGATKTDIGNITVTNSNGFAEGKNLKVTMSWDDFTCNGVSTTIPFILEGKTGDVSLEIRSGGNIIFKGRDNSTLTSQGCSSSSNHTYQGFVVWIKSEDWGKALAGDYTTTITYTAEVVVEQ